MLSSVCPDCAQTLTLVNDGGSLNFIFVIYIYVFAFFVKGNVLFDIKMELISQFLYSENIFFNRDWQPS